MTAPVIQFKRGLLTNLPGLRAGEPGFTTDSYDLYVGLTSETSTNKFFGSHRYWTKETTSTGSGINLVEGTTNGSGYITLKSPNSLAGVGTYTLPDTNTIVDGYFLKVAADGTLAWETAGGESGTFSNPTFTGITTVSGSFFDVNTNADFSGIVTFSNTTNNTLGDENTGAVQIDGGLGIAKNLTVKENLYVGGESEFVGVVTFKGGVINLGDGNTDNINVGGEFISNLTPNTDDTYDIGIGTQRWRNANFSGVGSFSHFHVFGDLNVEGNVTIGGTTVTLKGQDVFIENKDIVLGYTTSVTGQDISNDDTANHGGVAIASTVGTPLVSFNASGINTLPDTYKQMMWFKSGTLGFSTDVFAFNYGVAIGTTTVANGVRLAVGSGITMSDTAVYASNFYGQFSGTITGTASSATRAETVDTTATSTNATYFVPFVDTFAGQQGETLRVGLGVSVNPSDGSVNIAGPLSVGNATDINAYIKAGGGSNALYLYNNGDVSFQAKAIVNEIRSSSDASTLITLSGLDATFARNVNILGITTAASLNIVGATTAASLNVGSISVGSTGVTFVGSTSGSTIVAAAATAAGSLTLPSVTDTLVGKATTDTFTNKSIDIATAQGNNFAIQGNPITSYTGSGSVVVLSNLPTFGTTGIQLSGSTSGSTQIIASTVATGTLTLPSATDTLVGRATTDTFTNKSINLNSNTLTFTSSELATACTDETGSGSLVFATSPTLVTPALGSATATNITVSGDVYVGVALSAPTVRTGSIQSSNGTQAATIDSSGNITASQNLTVSGNLYVNGSTTQVNTESILVEDRTLELGLVNGSAPSAATTWDLGVLFNYNSSGAKKSGVVWEHADGRFKFASQLSDGGGTDNDSPQITFSAYAPIEISSLWVNDCAGQSQVINCSGGVRILENITIDAGSF